MHTVTRTIAIALATALLASLQAGASPAESQDQPKATEEPTASHEATPARTDDKTPVYKPPRRGAPKTRVGGGTRTLSSDPLPAIALLAPLGTGLTTRVSPTLYWHLSKSHVGPVEFVVMDRNSVEAKPLFRHVLEREFAAGFHAFDLAEFGVELDDGHTYQWSVAIVRDPDRRSQDIVSLATLERTVTPPSLMGDEPPVYQFASAGLWYDAIEALAPPPTTGSSRADLEALLAQVGLAGLD